MQTNGISAADAILSDYSLGRIIDRLQMPHRPDKECVYKLIDQLFSVLYFGCYPATARLADDPAEALRMTVEDTANFTVYIPKTDEHFTASLAVVPLQLLGYYTSVNRGLDVDKPRNLAKSVTVE